MFPMGTLIPDFLVGFPESIKVRLQHGWRGERTGTFLRHFCGSDRVAWHDPNPGERTA